MKALQELIKEFEIFKSIPIPSETEPNGDGDIEFGNIDAEEVDFSDENPFGDELDSDLDGGPEEEDDECACTCDDEETDPEIEFGSETDEFGPEEIDSSEFDEPLHRDEDNEKPEEFKFFN